MNAGRQPPGGATGSAHLSSPDFDLDRGCLMSEHQEKGRCGCATYIMAHVLALSDALFTDRRSFFPCIWRSLQRAHPSSEQQHLALSPQQHYSIHSKMSALQKQVRI